MVARKNTHLIYLDDTGYAWMQEHNIGKAHPDRAQFYCEVPSNEDNNWMKGRPYEKDVQFLTLCPFYPSLRLDVSVEMETSNPSNRYTNHPPFQACVKYMPVSQLDFRPIPKYIETGIYTIGLCYSGHQEPYKTVEVKADNKAKAMEKGRKELKPNTVEHICFVSIRPNEEFSLHQDKKPKFK